MRNEGAHIAKTAANIRPLVRLGDWTCTSAGPDFRLGAGLIRKARV